MFVQTDVTNWDELQNAFDKTIERFGRLDIVCPGAGVFEPVRQATFLSILRWNGLLTSAAILKLLALQQRNRHKRIIQL
jgi:NAD(P)-dependent dehydrogenase (short-subunit alcohol dehydrogenase family)